MNRSLSFEPLLSWAWLSLVLAPIVLTAMAGISLGIVSLTVVSLVRDADASGPVAVVIGALGIAQAVTCWQFLRGFAPGLVRDEIMRSRR